MNKFLIMGRLVRDVEIKTAQSGSAYANFSVAVNREMDREKADFFNCTAFGKTAENISKYFTKGSQILIEGSVQIDENDGKYYTKVMVNRFYFVDNKKTDNENSAPKRETTYQKPEQVEATFKEVDEDFYETSKALATDEDLPF